MANGLAHHRQNRRRERPGSRTRRSLTRKSLIHIESVEGLLDARDSSVPLPSDKAHPSPLLRHKFDASWQRWKAREAEEKALAEMDQMQIEQEQQRLFGGDADDDELYRMGILYDDNDVGKDFEPNTVAANVPVEQPAPMFVIKYSKPKRSRRSNWTTLPLYLSFSGLSDDADILRFISPSVSHDSTIQHRDIILPAPISTDIPLSLPTPSALASTHGSLHLDNTISVSQPFHSIYANAEDWAYINSPDHTLGTSTPSSEPETWILIDDS